MSNEIKKRFESAMSAFGMFESVNGASQMDVDAETGEYISADTSAMWTGFYIGWKLAKNDSKHDSAESLQEAAKIAFASKNADSSYKAEINKQIGASDE